MARREQQESEEVEKTPVRIKQKKVKITTSVLCRFIDRKSKATAYLHRWIDTNEQQISSWLYTSSSI